MLTLDVIIASTRPGRVGPTVADWFAARAKYTHQHTKDWSAVVEAADAFVFVLPEYNHGMSAPLKTPSITSMRRCSDD